MNDSLKELNLSIDKLISNYFYENQKSIENANKEKEELKNKIKELEYELKLSQMKVENLELKLELSGSKEDCCHCDDASLTRVAGKRQFGKRLFANFGPSPEKLCSEILARDTCAAMLGENDKLDQFAPKVMRSSGIYDENENELCVAYESELIQIINTDDNQSSKYYKDDHLIIETQLSQVEEEEDEEEEEEEEISRYSNNKIDLDETMIDCDPNENENEENQSPISFTQKTPDKSIKYVGPAVRKKIERQALKGFDCIECRKYYEALGETDSQIQSRIQQCSRHRARYVPPSTPEGFWDIGIPEPAEEPEVKLVKLGGRRGKKMQLPDRKWIQ